MSRQFLIGTGKNRDSAAIPLKAAIEQLRNLSASIDSLAIPVVCVPFMGAVGRALCEAAGIGWFDLSGNGWIRTQGLHVRVEGRPNRFKAKGRPADVFAPKSARITRWLLIHAGRALKNSRFVISTPSLLSFRAKRGILVFTLRAGSGRNLINR